MSIHKACLVLNASYEPIAVCSARRAITLYVKEACVIVEDYGREVYPGIMLPSVIRLAHLAKVPIRITMLTRENIYSRDRKVCQYCGRKAGEIVVSGGKKTSLRMTLDHIVPKSRGGQNKWENLVTCCHLCNHKKADRTPEEADMKLIKRPRRLTIHTSRALLRLVGLEEDSCWEKYIYA